MGSGFIGLDGPINGRLVPARAAAIGVLGAVVEGHVFRGHVDNAKQAAAEHAFPLALDDVLAVVATEHALGPPLLLEEGLVVGLADSRVPHLEEVVQVVLVPCLPNFLCAEDKGNCVSCLAEARSRHCLSMRLGLTEPRPEPTSDMES